MKNSIRTTDTLMEWYYEKPVEQLVSQLGELPFLLLNANNMERPVSITYSRKEYPFHVFEIVEKGKGRVTVDDFEFSVSAGDIYRLQAKSNHVLQPNPTSPWCKLYFVASGPLLDYLIDVYRLKGRFHFPSRLTDEIRQLFLEMIELNTSTSPNKHNLAAQNALKIIQILASKPEIKKNKSLEAMKIFYYLDRNMFKKLNLNKMAHDLSFSRSKLISLCKSELGATPYEIHLTKRLEFAKLLLIQKRESKIFEISQRLNFHDQYHFSRAFKSKYGLSPTQFRQADSLSWEEKC